MPSWSGHPQDAEVYWDPCPVVPIRGLQDVPLGFWAELEEENQVESPLKRPAVHLPLDKGARGA